MTGCSFKTVSRLWIIGFIFDGTSVLGHHQLKPYLCSRALGSTSDFSKPARRSPTIPFKLAEMHTMTSAGVDFGINVLDMDRCRLAALRAVE